MTKKPEIDVFAERLLSKHNLKTDIGKREFLAGARDYLKTLTDPSDIAYLESFLVQAFAVFLREMSRNEVERWFWGHVEMGFPEAKVERLVGLPKRKQLVGSQTEWIYPRGGSVCFVDGKVIACTPPKKSKWAAFKNILESLLIESGNMPT